MAYCSLKRQLGLDPKLPCSWLKKQARLVPHIAHSLIYPPPHILYSDSGHYTPIASKRPERVHLIPYAGKHSLAAAGPFGQLIVAATYLVRQVHGYDERRPCACHWRLQRSPYVRFRFWI
ncbi:predicted protein [Plenodomus lingam JN3]|uniref:Uncharacterized protein n=1 Tax=Leptosphaeria maculans (strain JN3 / isolate v23.1.3 / race Av1-4-5-6-7-8) TaxID=985895 RepID=E4ZGX0_LEPMJ|nr:predicted protein [Plenodomus lingam JN3]CBX90540.1 predicted protein [Plenodomus lingam JN3]